MPPIDNKLETTLEIVSTVTTLVPVVSGLVQVVMRAFKDATPDMTDEQRIELLREKGIQVEQTAERWLKEHGYE